MKIVRVLKSFGLSEYESRALLTLLSRRDLTAKEIAEISGIPRTSVYDVMNSLLEKGFVQASGKPLRFKALRSEEIISLISKKYSENLEYLKRELPKVESERGEEIDEIIAYRGDAVLSKLEDLVREANEVKAVLSYVPKEVRDILEKFGCRLIVVASNAKEIRRGERFEFEMKEEVKRSFGELCHGMISFDGRKVMVIFLGSMKLGIVSESRALIEYFSLLTEPLLNLFKAREGKGDR